MNIFVLDSDPREAARFHNDRHVASAVRDLTILLVQAHVYLDGKATARSRGVPTDMLLRSDAKTTSTSQITDDEWYVKGVTEWVRRSSGNYEWTWQHLDEMLIEFSLRFKRGNRFETAAKVLAQRPMNIEIGPRTEFYQRVPTRYRNASTVQAYRNFYFGERKHLAKWSDPRTMPTWWAAMELEKTG